MDKTVEDIYEEYFRGALDLFNEFQWLVKYPVTEILTKNLLDSIPKDWLDVLRKLNYHELNEFVIGKLRKSDWPSSLLSFLARCNKYNKLSKLPDTSNLKSPPTLPTNLCLGLNLKKQHEVSHLVEFIHDKCKAENIKKILDIGSGLGYIGQALNYLYGYRIVGVEFNDEIWKRAVMRTKKLFPESTKDIQYLCIKFDSNLTLLDLIPDMISNDSNERVCMIGLHACGDLGRDAVTNFKVFPQCKLMITISCCYHKISMCDRLVFEMSNPLINVLRDYETKINVWDIINRPFMRLACQETTAHWEEMLNSQHEQHAFCVLSRAVLELFTYKNNITLKKCVKKATRKSQCTDFNTYLTDTLKRYTFNDKNESKNNELINKIQTMWEYYEGKLGDVEIFTALQMLIQSSVESFVLEDRRISLEQKYERYIIQAELIPVFNSKISPRCQALVGTKKF